MDFSAPLVEKKPDIGIIKVKITRRGMYENV